MSDCRAPNCGLSASRGSDCCYFHEKDRRGLIGRSLRDVHFLKTGEWLSSAQEEQLEKHQRFTGHRRRARHKVLASGVVDCEQIEIVEVLKLLGDDDASIKQALSRRGPRTTRLQLVNGDAT